ncbi:heavy metal-binding protein HIP-like isoform X1 [Micropterus salmoides]|uniref:heavy metal-binding protein HIP-like isoform X1 n=1 Tax=Micropterus salmoides TaxID=27706 RepID=UPI0018ED9996|nr:heavy metal-binding protein HIP-like isoform X1 [Micropterus salmoides]
MRVFGLLLLLFGLCGSGAHGEGGGLGEVGEISQFQKTAPRDADEESTKQTTEQTTTDIWGEVRALRDMVVELKVELRNMKARVKDSESQVKDLKAELIVTKVLVDLLQKENSVQETRLTVTESITSDLERKNADLQIRLSSSEYELLVSKSRIDQLEREDVEIPKVAFYSALTDAGNVGPYKTDITLKYSKVFTNTGDAYNPATGFFTAPVKGVYSFQFTVCGNHKGNMGVYVYKNKQRMMYNAEWWANAGYEYLSNSVVLELIAGDEVHLVLPAGFFVFDNLNNHSTFSGSLLFPL